MDFDYIWSAYEKKLENFVKARLFDKSLASDILQEVAIKLYTHQNNFNKVDNIKAWIYKITRNTLIDFYKKNDKKIPIELKNENIEFEIDLEKNNEVQSCLTNIISKLNSSDEEILKLSIIEQYSIKEIAQKLNLSIDGTKSKLKRAKKKTQNKFFSCCGIKKDSSGKIIELKNNGTNCKC